MGGYLGGAFEEDGGFGSDRPSSLPELLRDAATAIRRFVGTVTAVGTLTPNGTWELTPGNRKPIFQRMEEYRLLCSSVSSAGFKFIAWEPETPEQRQNGVRVGALRAGRGVTTFPAALTSLTMAAAFACREQDINDGLVPVSALERLIRVAEQLEREAEMQAPPKDPPTDYVTLDQIASIVQREKRTLEKHRPKMPPPDVKGGGGKPNEWVWSKIRPWLEATFGRQLPESHPGVKDADRS